MEWLEVAPNTGNVGSILGRLALEAEQGPTVVVAGDTAYYPALLRDAVACEWNPDALALYRAISLLVSGSWPHAVATRIARRCETATGTRYCTHG